MNSSNRHRDSFADHPDSWRGADVVWDNVPVDDDDDQILELEPVDADATSARAQFHSADEIKAIASELEESESVNESSPIKFQFSLTKILMVTTVVAIAVALRHVLASGMLAGFLGFLVFGSLLLAAFVEVEDHRVKQAWWCLVGLYVLTSIVTVILG